jgi:hypothetical protein
MPDMLAHYLVADTAARQARQCTGRFVDHAFDAYKVGAQGPDVFFYSHVLRPRRRSGLAWLTHQQQTTAALRCMLERAAAFPEGRQEVAYAFVAGYAAHLCLDAEVHPWVMYWTGDITGAAGPEATAEAFRRHGILEASIDVLLRGERSVRTDWLRKQRLLHLPAAQSEVISELLSDMLRDVYGVVFTPAEGRAAFRAMEWIYATMSDPHAMTTRLLAAAAPLSQHRAVVRSQIYPATPSPTAASLYARRNPWRHPFAPNEPRTETFAELCDIATAETVVCLQAICEVAQGEAAADDALRFIGDRNMFTGLACDDPSPATVFAPDLEQLWSGCDGVAADALSGRFWTAP